MIMIINITYNYSSFYITDNRGIAASAFVALKATLNNGTEKQVLLFTEDGMVESFSNGQPSSQLKGREQLKQAFSGFLANFHTVYHQNGHQTIDELTENAAKATSYCRVILVADQEGKPMKTTLYTIYKDEFIKQNGQWLIRHRKSNFMWREVEEVK